MVDCYSIYICFVRVLWIFVWILIILLEKFINEFLMLDIRDGVFYREDRVELL